MEVRFYDSVDDALLKFAVVIAKAEGKWVFCKHKERDTYEIPGGHREPGEAIDDTAVRELQEETGAREFTIKPVFAYSVTGKNRVNVFLPLCDPLSAFPYSLVYLRLTGKRGFDVRQAPLPHRTADPDAEEFRINC